jgi:uncharacterized phage protein (TIGR02218 family)
MTLDLTSSNFRITEVYEITLSNGKKLYLTNYGGRTSIGGVTQSSELGLVDGNTYTIVPIQRSEVKFQTDLRIDTLKLEFSIHAFTISGKSIIQAVDYGWFDNAQVIIKQIDPTNTTDQREIFRGNVSKGINYNRKLVILQITSSLDLLKKSVPKIMYQEQCNHKLFDAYCGLVKANYGVNGGLEVGSSGVNLVSSTWSAYAANWFTLGEIVMTSGASNGISRNIRAHSGSNVTLYEAFNLGVEVGDTYIIYPGCDKSGTTCQTKFDNYVNFLGFEYIPNPEVLI